MRVLAALRGGLYLDQVQDRLVVRPVLALARAVPPSTRDWSTARWRAPAPAPAARGRRLARLACGNVQGYLTGLAAGAVLLVVAVVVVSR